MKSHQPYTKEFKVEAVKLVVEGGYTQAEASRRLGIDSRNLGRWVSAWRGSQGNVASAGKLSVEQEEIRRLRKENQRLQMERDILKKAAAFFANESV